jgi:hypothetical protein
MDLHRFRLYGKGGDVSKITNLEDNSRVIYNTDWLPKYEELRAEMIASYQLQSKKKEGRRWENNEEISRAPYSPSPSGF